MAHPILNIADLQFINFGHGSGMPGKAAPEQFEAKLGDIGRKLGAQKLGYNLTVVQPGKRAFPIHNHRVNEEMFFIVEGEGEIRIGKERYKVRQGDVIACPPGGPETAHQIVNTSKNAEMKYLAVSTLMSPEVVDYPDSGKFGVRADVLGPDGKPQTLRFLGHWQGSLDYWDGE